VEGLGKGMDGWFRRGFKTVCRWMKKEGIQVQLHVWVLVCILDGIYHAEGGGLRKRDGWMV